MKEERIRSFDEFWPFYVREHSRKANRKLHFLGTSSAMLSLLGAFLLKKRSLLMLAPLVGYGPAWVGHFFIEKNRPATFKYPLWSLAADLKMWSLMVRKAMDAEVDRVREQRSEPTEDEGGRVEMANGPGDKRPGANGNLN